MKPFDIYVCPWCGRTEKVEHPRISMPNLTCGPHIVSGFPEIEEAYFQMRKAEFEAEEVKGRIDA